MTPAEILETKLLSTLNKNRTDLEINTTVKEKNLPVEAIADRRH